MVPYRTGLARVHVYIDRAGLYCTDEISFKIQLKHYQMQFIKIQ